MDPMLAWASMKRLLLAALLLPGLAAAGSSSSQSFSTTLAPGQSHEACATLARDDTRSYHWKSDAPVDFNIHYHDGDKVVMPVERKGMRGDGGTFKAKAAQGYCWMWTARDKPAKVSGAVESGVGP